MTTQQVIFETTLVMQADGPDGRVSAIAMTADRPSRNGTVFPRQVIEAAMAAYEFPDMGFDTHPEPRKQGQIADAIVTWDGWDWEVDEGLEHVRVRGQAMPNEAGTNMLTLMDRGVRKFGVSVRGDGSGHIDPVGNRVFENLRVESFDVVHYPANEHSRLGVHEHLQFQESDMAGVNEERADTGTQEGTPAGGVPAVPASDMEALKASLMDEVRNELRAAQQEAKASETQTAPAPEDFIDEERQELEKAKAAIRENNRREQMRRLMDENLQTLANKYSPQYREHFKTQAKQACENALVLDKDGDTPVTDLFDKAVNPLREQYSEFTKADTRAQFIGDADRKPATQIQSTKPVFEAEVGLPAYARPAYDLWQLGMADKDMGTTTLVKESLRGFDWQKARKNMGDYPNMEAMFDILDGHFANQMTQQRLLSEFARYEQFGGLDGIFQAHETLSSAAPPAETTVSSVLMRLLPGLVGSNLFTVVPVTERKGQFPVENYSALAAGAGTAVDVAAAITAGTTFNLGQRHIEPGSVGFTARTGLVEGDDYVVDYSNGMVRFITAQAAEAGATMTFDFYSLSPAENTAATEIATGTRMEDYQLAFSAAKVYITEEAKANQAGLAWSIVDRSLFNASRRLEEQIDMELHLRAQYHMSDADSAATKSTGGSPSTSAYFSSIAQAKASIERKRLVARYLIGHNETLAGFTSADAFQRDGLPSYMLTPANMLGRIAGLTVIASPYWTNTTDFAIMEPRTVMLLMSRMNPIRVLGPTYGTDGSGNMLAADEYRLQVDYQITGGYLTENIGRIRGR